jgi:hypothetical protein
MYERFLVYQGVSFTFSRIFCLNLYVKDIVKRFLRYCITNYLNEKKALNMK